ncbi:transmembrane protein 70 homolog, mitochondrial isoform X2 [Augochlora pura]
MELDSPKLSIALASLMIMYTTCSPLLIHYLMGRKYVIDLYYNDEKKEYIAETYSLFNQRTQIVFTEDEVRVPDVTGPFTTCYVRGIPLFLNESEFPDMEYFHKIMGHYKPIDFHLGHNIEKIKEVSREKQ